MVTWRLGALTVGGRAGEDGLETSLGEQEILDQRGCFCKGLKNDPEVRGGLFLTLLGLRF